MKVATDELTATLNEIMQKVYAQANPQGAPGANAQGAAGGANQGGAGFDNTVDADYNVVDDDNK